MNKYSLDSFDKKFIVAIAMITGIDKEKVMNCYIAENNELEKIERSGDNLNESNTCD